MNRLDYFNYNQNNKIDDNINWTQKINVDEKTDTLAEPIFKSSLVSSVPESFEEKMRKFREEESLFDSSNIEDISDSEFENISSYILDIPPASPFANTDLILFKDNYSGLMPLNGIRESELTETEQLLKKIEEGQSFLEIDTNDKLFFQEIVKEIKKLLTRNLGRKLINKVCQSHNKISIIKSFKITTSIYNFERKDTCYFAVDAGEGKIIHDPNAKFFMIGINPSGKRCLFLLSSYIILGHELIHAISPKISIDRELSPSMEQEYDNLSEQKAITGLSENLSFPEKEEGEFKTDEEKEKECKSWIEANYQELNERDLTAVFTRRPAFFYPRMGHHGLFEHDQLEQSVHRLRLTAHPIMEKYTQELKEQLSQIKELPAPVDFIVDCLLWLNTLSDQPSSIKNLHSLLNSLNAVKTIASDRLSAQTYLFEDEKQFGDWKQEKIDQLFKNLFNGFKRFALRTYVNSVPKQFKSIFDKLFKSYIDNWKLSPQILILTDITKKNIQEELFDYLVQEKAVTGIPLSAYDEKGNFTGKLIVDYFESFLRLQFVEKSEYTQAQELICYLIKDTKYFLKPSCYPLTFLQALKNSWGLDKSEFDHLVSFFEPALKLVLQNFLRQISGEQEQEPFFFLLFEDLFNHPKTLMQEFRDKKQSYAHLFLNYLSTHPEKTSALSPAQQQDISNLIKQLEKGVRALIKGT